MLHADSVISFVGEDAPAGGVNTGSKGQEASVEREAHSLNKQQVQHPQLSALTGGVSSIENSAITHAAHQNKDQEQGAVLQPMLSGCQLSLQDGLQQQQQLAADQETFDAGPAFSAPWQQQQAHGNNEEMPGSPQACAQSYSGSPAAAIIAHGRIGLRSTQSMQEGEDSDADHGSESASQQVSEGSTCRHTTTGAMDKSSKRRGRKRAASPQSNIHNTRTRAGSQHHPAKIGKKSPASTPTGNRPTHGNGIQRTSRAGRAAAAAAMKKQSTHAAHQTRHHHEANADAEDASSLLDKDARNEDSIQRQAGEGARQIQHNDNMADVPSCVAMVQHQTAVQDQTSVHLTAHTQCNTSVSQGTLPAVSS